MRVSSISMRVWLALVVAVIVSVTAVAVADVLTVRSEAAFRARAEDLAAGSAVIAAGLVSAAPSLAEARSALAAATSRRRIALFLFDGDGTRISNGSSNGVAADSVAGMDDAVAEALAGHRLVTSTDGGRRIVVALPLRSGAGSALVAVASRPDLVAAGDIVRGQLLLTVLIAIVCGAALGTAVAFLITSRVRRVTRAATEIERGNFDKPLSLRFNDELGQLGSAVDGMRLHLRDSFAALEVERDNFRNFLEQLQEGVVAVDRDLLVVFANSRARLQIGRRILAPGEPLPEPWPECSLRDLAASLFDPAADGHVQRVHTPSGHTYSVAGIPVRATSEGVLLVITDITVADRRERAEREFVTNAAHELRTPIAAIVSAVEVLQGGGKAEAETRDRFLAVIGRQSDRLERLIHALLTLARAQTQTEPITLEPIDIGALLEETAHVFRERGDVAIEVECPPGLTAESHYDLLYQAIGNLAENAVKHADGSAVRLSAAELAGDRVRIEVSDDGPGILAGERERLFDRFYRGGGSRTAEGFGLGLSIVGGVTAILGGEVELEARDAGGTTASITLDKGSEPR